PDLEREALQGGPGHGERRQQGRVPVALDDLSRRGLRFEAELLTGRTLDLGIDRRIVPDGARELSDPHAFERMRHARARAVELECADGELEAEGRRLGMNAVRAPD